MDNIKHIDSEMINGVGWIRLNRPEALNALTLPMIREIFRLLIEWENHDSVAMVCMYGVGDKAYCAGGDVRQLYDLKDGNIEPYAFEFFSTEYKMNMLMHNYKKPILAYMNGIVMGGGVGISVGAKYRIVTEETKWAMPEMNIGLYPDVGGSYFLNCMPGQIGRYLALTSSVIGATDVLYAGAADYFILSHHWEDLRSTIEDRVWYKNTADDQLKTLLGQYIRKLPGESKLKDSQFRINQHFEYNRIEDIVQSLKEAADCGDEWAQSTLKTVGSKSPTSLKVTLEQLIRGKGKLISECLEMEINMSMNFMKSHDFFEGVRAVLVDKDRDSKWHPHSFAEVSEEEVNSFFKYPWKAGFDPLGMG